MCDKKRGIISPTTKKIAMIHFVSFKMLVVFVFVFFFHVPK